MPESIRCVGLLSGGLDSILATRAMLDQGLDVYCINFKSPFCTCTAKGASCSAAQSAVRQIGDVELEVQIVGDEYLEVIKHPKHGRGKGMNPCLDCRAFKFRQAQRYAESIGAKFLFTGEVLGQRPMSQHRRAMDIIDRDADLVGWVLRPLSAQLMEETIPEQKGWVDREQLLDFSGRTRRPQMALAEEMGIDEYPCAAGGCLLADKGFARRLKDLFDRHPDCTAADMHLLKLGRHFRLPEGAKLIVGRNEGENRRLEAMAAGEWLAYMPDEPGPMVMAQDLEEGDAVQLAGDAAIAHSSVDEGVAHVFVVKDPSGEERQVEVTASAPRDELWKRLDSRRL